MSTMVERRARMVERQLAARGIRDRKVLDAMRSVPRELFVPAHLRGEAYDDTPLPIGSGQTISQPYMVASMIEALELMGGEKALEVGAGSGYAAAVMARIAAEVLAIERIGELAALAAQNLAAAGVHNVRVRHADGTEGWPEEAPFDCILVSAGAPALPATLMRQLRVGGRMVVPIGDVPGEQKLTRVTRTAPEQFSDEDLGDVRFVPLIGREGWPDGEVPPDDDQATG